MLDGLGKDLTTHIDNSNKFFKNGNFSNVWSNAEWTLPSFSNLIMAQEHQPMAFLNQILITQTISIFTL